MSGFGSEGASAMVLGWCEPGCAYSEAGRLSIKEKIRAQGCESLEKSFRVAPEWRRVNTTIATKREKKKKKGKREKRKEKN